MNAAKNNQTSMEPIWVRASVACKLSGIGMTTLYEWIKQGHLEAIRINGKRLISVASIKRLGQSAIHKELPGAGNLLPQSQRPGAGMILNSES